MTEKPTDTSGTNEPIGQWLSETRQLASVVLPEQRPQLIVLIPVLIFSQILIFSSELSDGIKVLLSFSSSIGLLWLAFFVLPKQARAVEAMQNRIDSMSQENQALEDEQSSLEEEFSETKSRLSESITSAYECLENIENKIAITKEHTREVHTKDCLIEISHYVNAKKREFDSALSRVSTGGEMIESKEAAGADLLADFHALQDKSKKVPEQVSQDQS